MKKTFLPLATALVAGFALTSCGPAPVADPRPNNAYVLGEATTLPNGFQYFKAYQLSFYDNNVYELTQTQITYGYSMNLGTEVVMSYGTYATGTTVDGVASYTLNKASEVILSSYSKMGGFNIAINTASSTQTYPTELPASGEGEKVYAQNKDDVINKYGPELKVFTNDKNNAMELKDPNAD